MTEKSLTEWIQNRQNMKYIYFCNSFGNTDEHIYKYENGEEYIHREIYDGIWKKRIENFINKKLVSAKNMQWENYGWKTV